MIPTKITHPSILQTEADIRNPKVRRLLHDFYFTIYFDDGNRVTIQIESGYEWDGSSTPRLLWAVEPPFADGSIFRSLLHDKGREYAGRDKHWLKTFDQCYELMKKQNGDSWLGRKLTYAGVRLGTFAGVGVQDGRQEPSLAGD